MTDCLPSYLRHGNRDDQLPMGLRRIIRQPGAVFRRLGFLAAYHLGAAALAQACRTRLTSGDARLARD